VRSLLICHKGSTLDRIALARWLNESSDLMGIVVIDEARSNLFTRVKRELRRSGWLRFLDVLAYRIYRRLFLVGRDRSWRLRKEKELANRFSPLPDDIPVLITNSPNTSEVKEFVQRMEPDLMLARCKHLLRSDIFNAPAHGTYVMHPGVCPEYRNAHGCFWALANDDREKVGMTLLRIDEGVDTGPVYGYYSYEVDEVNETPYMIQYRVVLENLDSLAVKLQEIADGSASTVDTAGRRSEVWGQPWLTKYFHWKRSARLRAAGRRARHEVSD